MMRGAPAVRIRPKFVLVRPDVGLLKFALFSALKISQRNWILRSAKANVRVSARSFWNCDGPTKAFGFSVL